MYYVITLKTTYLYPYNVLYQKRGRYQEFSLESARIMARMDCIFRKKAVYILDDDSNIVEGWVLMGRDIVKV